MKRFIALSLLLVSSVGFGMREEVEFPPGIQPGEKEKKFVPTAEELGARLRKQREQMGKQPEAPEAAELPPPPPPPLVISTVSAVQRIQVADLMKLYSQWYNYVQQAGVVAGRTSPGGPFGDLIGRAGKGFTAIINKLYSQKDQPETVQVSEKFAERIYRLSTLIKIAPIYGAGIYEGSFARDANPEAYPNLPFAGALGKERVVGYIWREMASFTKELTEEIGLSLEVRTERVGMGVQQTATPVYTLKEKEEE